MTRKLNEVALLIRPLFTIPTLLIRVAADYLKTHNDEYARLKASGEQIVAKLPQFIRVRDTEKGSYCKRCNIALEVVYGIKMFYDITQHYDLPTAQLAPVLQLTYTPETPKTVSGESSGGVSLPTTEAEDNPAETVYGGFSGMPAPATPQEPLFYKKGRRYVEVNGTPVQGQKFKRVMKGKAVRYVPA